MIRAAEELAAVAEYDYAIVNEDLVAAVSQVAAILEAERRPPGAADRPAACVQIERLRRDVAAAAEKKLKQSGQEPGVGRPTLDPDSRP